MVDLRRDGGPGLLVITGGIGRAAATKIEIRDGHRGGGNPRWSTLDLLRGSQMHPIRGHRAVLEAENYVQYSGVRAGSVTMVVTAEGDMSFAKEVRILPGSGVYRSNRGPARVILGALGNGSPAVAPGRWQEVPIAILNRGDRPVRGLAAAATGGNGLTVRTRVAVPEAIGPHQEATGSIWLRPDRPGKLSLTVSAVSNANHPGARYFLVAGDTGGGGGGEQLRRIGEIAAGMLILAGLYILCRSIARWSTDRSRPSA